MSEVMVAEPEVRSAIGRVVARLKGNQAVVDARAENARPTLLNYAVTLVQLAAAFAVVIVFRLEEPRFAGLLGIVALGFAIHYWLPFRAKEPFLIVFSIVAMSVLLSPWVASAALLVGLAIYVVAASKATYGTRLAIILGAAALLTALRAGVAGDVGIPSDVWPVLGSIFMFRLIIYFYDLRHMKAQPSLREYLSYFFILPNFYFLLFPVVDFQTMRKSYYQRNITAMTQTGVSWIVRGIVQLLLYRLVYQYRLLWSADAITTPWMLVREMLLIYMLYLRVSGTFHIIIGMMHLFGFDLPETHRRYLLASSMTDFWRRINIYWKDFMVKVVYFPLYFRMRKQGDARAQIVATACVFLVTWALHGYQTFWISGHFPLTGPDIAFWSILGGLVIVNVLMERRRRKRAAPGMMHRVQHGVQILATFSLITVLWSLWNTPTIAEWLDIITWWRVD